MLIESLGSADFIAGLRWGLFATGVALPIGVIWRARVGKPAPIHGLLAAGAFLMAVAVVRQVDLGLWLAVLLLLVGGALSVALGRSPLLAPLLALPGAWWLVSRADLPQDGWFTWPVVSAVVLAAPLLASFDERDQGRAWGPGLWLLSVSGIFVGVPDTEEALVLLGVSAPLALLGWPLRLLHIGPGALSLLGVFMWAGAWGGRGRPAATVAITACLGLMLIEPVIRWVGRRAIEPTVKATIGVFFVQLVIVLLASRWAARSASVATAAVLGSVALAIGAVGLAVVQRISRRRRR